MVDFILELTRRIVNKWINLLSQYFLDCKNIHHHISLPALSFLYLVDIISMSLGGPNGPNFGNVGIPDRRQQQQQRRRTKAPPGEPNPDHLPPPDFEDRDEDSMYS